MFISKTYRLGIVVFYASIITTFLSGCSTHFFLEGQTLEDQGAFVEAVEQFERATKGKKKSEAYEALTPLYLKLNVHERALACIDSIENISGLTEKLLFDKAETLMSLGRYDEAKEIYEECRISQKVEIRLATLSSLDERQADSIYFKVRPITIISKDPKVTTVASASLPRRVGGELYFVAESPRNHSQRRGAETFIDDYTGNRLMDLWKGVIVDTPASEPSLELLSEPLTELNTEFHDGIVAHISSESMGVLGKTYTPPQLSIFDKLARPAGEKVLYPIQLFEAELITSSTGLKTWETGARLHFCDDKYMFAHPAVSPDGKTLYFTSDMPGGYGGMDLWSSEKTSGEWGDPKNLGPIINTNQDDAFATLRHPDTLFFSSCGHMGLGGFDIVFATRTAVSEEWLDVVDDLPYPINSSGDDFGVQLYPEGFHGVYTSDRHGIDALYEFSDYDPVITLFVETIHESDGSPWPGIDAALEILGNPELEEFKSDSTGKWSTTILREHSYMIQCPSAFRYSADTFFTPVDQTQKSITIIVPIPLVIVGCMDLIAINYNSEAIVDDGLCEYAKVVEIQQEDIIDENIVEINDEDTVEINDEDTVEINDEDTVEINDEDTVEINDEDTVNLPKEINEGDIVNLDLLWDLDKAEIRRDDKPIIEAFARHLIDNPDQKVLMISHCDSRATFIYNDSLSQARAGAVREALVGLGVSIDRITTYGASKQFLLEECEVEEDCNESVHQANRRTTATILRPDQKVFVHRVKSRETLFGLAKENEVALQDIKAWNGLKSDKIRVGQDLLIYLP